MPKDCPDCHQVLERLLQEVREMKTNKSLAAAVAAKMERDLQTAMTAAKKDTQDLNLILSKLNGAKALIAGDAAASSLYASFTETINLVNRHLP